ncbi:MAG: trigger factor family protein [Potamolinea sp.]
MKVTQEKLPKSQIGLEIEIPAETTKKAYEKVVQNLSRSANIPGFRKGKVPRQILLQQMGPQRIKEAALEELVQDGLKQAIAQEAIDALGQLSATLHIRGIDE